jgi:hypothetical protein
MRNVEKLSWIQKTILAPLGLAALVSLVTGIRHAIEYGCHDLQWMGIRLVGQRIDPWQEELERFPHHFPHFITPNYLHSLYLILFPLGLLSFKSAAILWTVSTICLSIACIFMLRRLFDLDNFQTAVALCLLWMSSPFRVVLEVGQMSFFELFFLTGAYLSASTLVGGLSFGVSLAKYSFSPSAAVLFLLRGRVRFLLYAIAVPAVGLLGVWLLVRTPLLKLALEPFAVSAGATAVSPGFADLMTLIEQTLKSYVAPMRALKTAYALGLLGSAFYAFLLSRFRLSRAVEFTLISIASLFFVKHLTYDYVFLVVLLCFALKQTTPKSKMVLIGGVLAFWFVLPIFDKRWQSDVHVNLGLLALNCGLLAGILAIATRLAVTSAAPAPEVSEAELSAEPS